jgi:hypothetical protein
MQASSQSFSRRTIIKLTVAVALFLVAVLLLWRNLGGGTPAADANTRVFMCIETGKTFEHRLEAGEREPILSPHSGRETGWCTEACYWTPDGRAKKTPDYVVLKRRMGVDEPTYCPVCGREVVPHNPLPPPELMAAAE